MQICDKPGCHEYRLSDKPCACTLYNIVIPDHVEEDDCWQVWARDGEDAAQKAAERHDQESAEYGIASGRDDGIVKLRRAGGDGEWTTFKVEGGYEPYYRAEPVEA